MGSKRKTMGRYMSIPQAAQEVQVSHKYLRQLLKRHELPGFYSGREFKVDCVMLQEKLDADCRAAMKGDGGISPNS